jgi:hypothetical protein
MNKGEKMDCAEYYIGDLSWVIDYELREEILRISGYKSGIFSLTGNFNGKNLIDKKVAVKFGEIVDFSDNFGFTYNINSEIFGVLESDLIDENLLDERILKIKDGFLYNKFSAEKLAKIVKLNTDLKIKIEPNFMQIGEICVKF